MSYKEKYIKYKIKYLNLLKQTGGMWNCSACTFENADELPYCELCGTKRERQVPRERQVVPIERQVSKERQIPREQPREQKTFYIYTTGIGEWGDITRSADTWDKIMREMVLRNIHPSFTRIIIRHYDPLYDMDNKRMEEPKRHKLIEELNSIVRNDMRVRTMERQIESSFNDTALDFDTIQSPHILIDLAHLLYYYPNSVTEIGGNYGELIKKRFTTIKSIYPGYVGGVHAGPIIGYSNQYLAGLNLFRMDMRGNITTYIDKMFELNYVRGILYDPSEKISELFNAIRKLCDIDLRKLGKSVMLTDTLITPEISKDIIRYILLLIFEEKLKEGDLVQRVYDEKVKQLL